MSRADALTAEQAEHAPHFCQNEHAPIRHWDSENERCPLCRARDALNAIDELWYEDAGKHARPSLKAHGKMIEVISRYWDEGASK